MKNPTPYAITYMYGENGSGHAVELRFNWITDAPVTTYLICEAQETFEANGFRFSPAAQKTEAVFTPMGDIKDGGEIDYSVLVNDTIRAHINHATYYSHKAEITVEAGRSYYYAVGCAKNQTEPTLIQTRPANPGAFSILWITDPQQDKYSRDTPYVSWDGKVYPECGGNFQENLEPALAHAYAPEQAHLYVNGSPDFALCTGDHSEHIYDKDGFDGFFRAGKKMLSATAYTPAIGNHDLMGAPAHTGTWDSPDPFASYFKGRFNPPHNGAAYTGGENGGAAAHGDAAKVLRGTNYFFTYGNALIMVLQGNAWHTANYALDEQIQWMHYVAQTHGQGKWKIVTMHHGIYNASHNSVVGYEKLVPAFDQLGIDLVLNGHNHVYARSKPMKNFLPTEKGKGTVYITGGTISSNCAWGGYIYKPDRTVPEDNGLPMKDAAAFLSLTDLVDENNKNIYHVITVDENGINITAIRARDNTVVRHNAPGPSDVPEEYRTQITGVKPLL